MARTAATTTSSNTGYRTPFKVSVMLANLMLELITPAGQVSNQLQLLGSGSSRSHTGTGTYSEIGVSGGTVQVSVHWGTLHRTKRGISVSIFPGFRKFRITERVKSKIRLSGEHRIFPFIRRFAPVFRLFGTPEPGVFRLFGKSPRKWAKFDFLENVEIGAFARKTRFRLHGTPEN